MRWDMIGAMALLLIVVFVVGRIWYSLVETVLGGLKRLLGRKQPPDVWHSFAPEDDQREDFKS